MAPIPTRHGNKPESASATRPPSSHEVRGLLALFFLLAPVTFVLAGTYTVDSGNVAVEKTLGKVSMDEVGEGLHWRVPFLTKVTEFSAKTIAIELNDMTPKAADNLSLRDLDVTVYYRVQPEAVAELAVKYASASQRGQEAWLPAFAVVYRDARGAIYNAVSEINSLELHRKRTVLGQEIESALRAALEEKDPGVFEIDRVVIRALNTDPTIEQSIQLAVQNQKKLEAKQVEQEIARVDAEIEKTRAEGLAAANQIINKSLTHEYLQHELNEALKMYGDKGCPATIIPANMTNLDLLMNAPTAQGR